MSTQAPTTGMLIYYILTLEYGEVVVDHLGERGEAVGGTGGVRHH